MRAFCAGLLVCGLVVGGGPRLDAFPGSIFWKPVSPEELALREPRVEPGAGVEIVFREVEIDDSEREATRFHNYVRLKVYDQHGVAALEQVEIIDAHDAPIAQLAARVVKPDGTVIEVPRSSIHARELMRQGAERVWAKVFALPALVPGSVVEYQWEERSTGGIGGLQLHFQERFPAWRVRFRIKPFNYAAHGFELVPAGFRYELPELAADPAGFYAFEQTNVPALCEEPWMPPDDMVQSWVMLYFVRRKQSPEQFWQEAGRDLALAADRLAPATHVFAQRARDLIGDATDEREQLLRLGRFCRDQIARTPPQPGALVREPHRAGVQGQSAEQTWQTRAGTPAEINLLFIALARAAGFEAHLACIADRSKRLFREPLPTRFFLPDELVAVRRGEEWQFFDPANRHVAMGALRWENTGVIALICRRRDSIFVQTPRTPDRDSQITRSAQLQLAEDGSARGRVIWEHRGHCAEDARRRLDGSSGSASLADALAALTGFTGAQLDDVLVQHLADPDVPLVISARVELSHFAHRGEARLLFPVAIFQRGVPPVFTAAQREHVIYRRFGFVEEDRVEIQVPPGWVSDPPSDPVSFALSPALEYRAEIHPTPAGDALLVRRSVVHGGMLFPRSAYRLFKAAFDDLYRQDGRMASARPRLTAEPRGGE